MTWDQYRNVFDNKSSPECIALARSWLQECVASHQDCHIDSSQLPTRVIHVGSPDTEPRLYSGNGEHVEYMALSYC
jgi:hypothetical protein